MANTETGFSANASSTLPIPILTLGENYILQHNRGDDYNTWIGGTFNSSFHTQGGQVSQDGTAWANNPLKVGVSFADGEWDTFLSNMPMIFLEVLNQRNSKGRNKRLLRPQWSHPVNFKEPINRTATNYGGGKTTGLTTEWDLTSLLPFAENVIEIQQQFLYRNSAIKLPQRWVDFIFDSGNQLRYQRGYYTTPTGTGERVVNTFKQPIRFRFAYIDPNDGRSVVLGEPSEELVISPKWGHFAPQDDTYIYDWQIRFHK